ncbi:MAG: hypothetical protein ACYCY3_03715 [Halothiobacillus sp.]
MNTAERRAAGVLRMGGRGRLAVLSGMNPLLQHTHARGEGDERMFSG